MVCVVSLNEILPSEYIPQLKEFEWDSKVVYMLMFMTFAFLWLHAWLEYSSVFITSMSASTYYFNSNAKLDGSAEVLSCIRFLYLNHCGSVALGAGIIAFVRFVLVVFLFISK